MKKLFLFLPLIVVLSCNNTTPKPQKSISGSTPFECTIPVDSMQLNRLVNFIEKKGCCIGVGWFSFTFVDGSHNRHTFTSMRTKENSNDSTGIIQYISVETLIKCDPTTKVVSWFIESIDDDMLNPHPTITWPRYPIAKNAYTELLSKIE